MEDTLQNNNNQEQQNQQVVNNVVDGEVSQRTKEQFEKLTTSNQSLNQENEVLKRQIEALRNQSAQQPVPQVQTVQQSIRQAQASGVDPASYVEVDPKTGERFVDEVKLNKVIEELQSKTIQAEQTINNYIKTNEDRRLQQQREAAYKAHPELEPSSEKFDKKFYQKVRATVLDSMMNASEYGKVLSLKEAADYVKTEIVGPSATPTGATGEKQQDNGMSKVEAGTFVSSQPQNAPIPTNSEELRLLRIETRKGNPNALAQRLLATDHVLKK